MSALRSRLRRLASLAGEPSPQPVVLHLEVFGDDRGGGWRDRKPGDHSDVVTQMADGRTAIARLVVIAEGRD